MNEKIICITPIKHIDGASDKLGKCGETYYFPDIDKSSLRDRLLSENINIIFTNPNKQTFRIDKELLCGSSVKIISTASTGTNHIDMAYCRNNNMVVLSLTKDYDIIKKITSTAEMAFTLMLSLIRNLPSAIMGVHKYEWDYEKYIGRQLDHLTVGIIGYGRLGEHYARFCSPFFKEILITDPYKDVSGYVKVELDELLEKSDVIVLHV
ncbi:MAG: NAD(P)-dependent oxidoreductase, partial [Candidatus Asgardarchaeia archaeon]